MRVTPSTGLVPKSWAEKVIIKQDSWRYWSTYRKNSTAQIL